jgi:hypothetical protein
MFMPWYLPSVMYTIIIDSFKIAIAHIADIKVTRKTESPIAINEFGLRIASGIGGP